MKDSAPYKKVDMTYDLGKALLHINNAKSLARANKKDEAIVEYLRDIELALTEIESIMWGRALKKI